MAWEKIIEKDKITSVSDEFYDNVLKKLKIHIQSRKTERFFHKKHIWMSVAAGILLGLIMLNLQNHIQESELKISQMEAWINRYYLDDMVIEKVDCTIF